MSSKSFDDHMFSSVCFGNALTTYQLMSWSCIPNVIFLVKNVQYTSSIVFPGKLQIKFEYQLQNDTNGVP